MTLIPHRLYPYCTVPFCCQAFVDSECLVIILNRIFVLIEVKAISSIIEILIAIALSSLKMAEHGQNTKELQSIGLVQQLISFVIPLNVLIGDTG